MIRSSLKRGLKKVLGIPNRPGNVQPQHTESAPAPSSPSSPSSDDGMDDVVQAVGFADTIEKTTADTAAVDAEAPVEAVEVAAAPAEEPVAAAAAPAAAAPAAEDGAIDLEEVQEILDDMVRPALQADGGDITLLKIENNDIYVKLVGSCSSCPSSVMTMKMGVEALLKEEFPMMGELVQVDAMMPQA